MVVVVKVVVMMVKNAELDFLIFQTQICEILLNFNKISSNNGVIR